MEETHCQAPGSQSKVIPNRTSGTPGGRLLQVLNNKKLWVCLQTIPNPKFRIPALLSPA